MKYLPMASSYAEPPGPAQSLHALAVARENVLAAYIASVHTRHGQIVHYVQRYKPHLSMNTTWAYDQQFNPRYTRFTLEVP